MLIDTGAEVTLAHQRVVRPNLHNLRTCNRRLTGVTGETLEVLGALDLDLKLHNETARHEIIVVKDIPYDVIVGKDFLEKENYTLKFQPRNTKEYIEQAASVRLNKILSIPAASRQYLWLQPNRQLDQCAEARVRPVSQIAYGTWVEDAVTDISDDGKVLICIINTNPHSITLARRTRLATVTSYSGQRVNNIQIKDWVESELADESRPKTDTERGPFKTPRASQSRRTETVLRKINQASLSASQQAIVKRLVEGSPGCFALEGEALPATQLVEYHIPTGDAEPVRKRAYRTAECHKEPLKEIIHQLKSEGIIKPSCSSWSAPVILVPKKQTGSYRLVVDHRGLNQVLRRDNYPLPRVDDLLDHLKASRVFSVLDMRSGFHQIKIADEDTHKTAFVCSEGLFEYLRMSMGMSNAPSCFQRLLETIFADMITKGVLIYIDDIVIYSETEEQHELLLKQVLRRLEAARLSLRPEKCQFFQEKVSYLGHLVSAEGLYPLHENVKKVQQYPVPLDINQLRSFVGLASYYRKFVKGFAEIAKPLTEMTKKDRPWVWGETEQQAFETLKTRLIEPPILGYPRFDSPFTLTTDASNLSIGSILSQIQEGAERVIAYGSRSLTAAEQNYSTTEKECLSIVHFVKEYRHYLLGRHFIIESDHAPLSILNQQQEPKGRLGRWQLQLSEFDFELRYRPGKVIRNADAMSRIPVNEVNHISNLGEDLDINDDGIFLDGSLGIPKIKIAQQKDGWCSNMINYLRRQELPAKDDNLAKRVVLESSRYLIRGDGILTYLPDTKIWVAPEMGVFPVIVLPGPLHQAALGLLHDHCSAGHLGFQKTLRKVQERFFWPRMYSDIQDYTKSCVSCAKVKTPPVRRKAPHTTYQRAQAPLDCIEIDIVGPIAPAARDGSTVILVVTDLFTKFAEAYPLEHQKAPLIAKTLVKEFFSRYGSPKIVRTDQGKNFTSTLVKEICKLYQIKHITGSSYHPESQGAVERQNRTLVEMLKHYTQGDVFNWADYIPHTLLAYNTAINSSTLYSPYSLFFGRPARLPLDAIIHKPGPNYRGVEGYREEVAERLYIAHQNARQNSEAALAAQKKYYDQRAKKRDFRIGDTVYITNERKKAKRKSKEDCRKFRMAWLGPCKIMTRKGEVTYLVQHLDSGKKEVVHENRLKLAYPRCDPLLEPREEVDTGNKLEGRLLRSSGKQSKRQQEVQNWCHITPGGDSGTSEDDTSDDNEYEDQGDEVIPEENNINDDASELGDEPGSASEYSEDETEPTTLEESNDNGDEEVAGDTPMRAGHPMVLAKLTPLTRSKSAVTKDTITDGGQDESERVTYGELREGSISEAPTEGVEVKPIEENKHLEPSCMPKMGIPPLETASLPDSGKGLRENPMVVGKKRGRPPTNKTHPTDAIPLGRRLGLQERFNQSWGRKLELERSQGKLYHVDLYHVLGTNQPDPLEHDYVVGLKLAAEKKQGPPQASGDPPRRSERKMVVHLTNRQGTDPIREITHAWPDTKLIMKRGQVVDSRYEKYYLG